MRVSRDRRYGAAGDARKDEIGTAISETSRVWFTLARGGLDEVFYPSPDAPAVRGVHLWVGDVADADMAHHFSRPDDRVPLVVIDTHGAPYSMRKETVADPRSNVVVQRIRRRSAHAHRLHLELDLERSASAVGKVDHCDHVVLAADFGDSSVALAANVSWAAINGLCGDLAVDDVTLALGFGEDPAAAARVAVGAVIRGFDAIRSAYETGWREWNERLEQRCSRPVWTRSVCVLKTLEAKHIDGGRVAALAKPWGTTRPAEESGSYHLVWTRDLAQTMGGLIAAGAHDEARQALTFLGLTQRRDGYWPQNMRVDGTRVWDKIENDETALPILLVQLLRREGLLHDDELEQVWNLVARAAHWLSVNGPSTRLDRWEDVGGLTPFTIGSEIAALRAAAELADTLSHPVDAHRFRALAQRWDDLVDDQLYRRGGPLAERLGIAGYYVRARMPGEPLPELDADHVPKTELSPDALALVRFGVRAADDPRIVDTVRAIDAVLRTTVGWRRYPGDSYGEHADGTDWDGDGIGRSWPLLVGERAHYELASGNRREAEKLCAAMVGLASETGMLPEQSWDAPDIADRKLWRGAPTHSAAPLGWAHAEYIKLCRSLADGRVFDMPRSHGTEDV